MKRLNPIVLVLSAIVAMAVLSGCGVSGVEPERTATRNVVDMSGRTVAVPVTVNRVAANGMSLTQLILLLGAERKLAATMPAIKADPWYGRVFHHLKTIPAPFMGIGVHIEELLAAKPQVVFLWSETDNLRDRITALGIPVVVLSYSDPAGLKRAVSIMGNVLGPSETKTAKKFIKYYDGNIKRALAGTASLPASKLVRVYYVSSTPLTTEGGGTMVNAWIGAAGGVNVADRAGLRGIGVTVSMEDILRWNPEVIIVRDAKMKNEITSSPQWRDIDAVRKQRVYVNPKGVNVWCARSGDGALQMLWAARTLHPGLFRDLDMEGEVRTFYSTFYNYRLSGEELDLVMRGAPPPS
jgi:iron complex transport system substrate-binding protein